MRAIGKIAKVSLILIMAVVFAFGLSACNKESKQEVAFGTALANTRAAEDKSIDTAVNFAIILYDSEGAPMKVSQQFTLNRSQKDGAIYAQGDFNIVEYNLSTMLKLTVIGVLTQVPKEIGDYINKKSKGHFEFGYKDDVVNIRGDIHNTDALPDFKVAFRGNEYDLFAGLSYADILAEQQSMGYDFVNEYNLPEMIMQPLFPEYDYTNVNNELGNKMDSSNQFHYKFAVPGASFLQSVLGEIDKSYSELMEKEEDEEFAAMLEDIYAYYDMLESWITIDDTVFTCSADEQGRLTASDYVAKMTLRVSDADIIRIGTELELATAAQIEEILNLIHGFFTSPNGVKNALEVSFVISVQENISYNPQIDLNNIMFTPLSEDLEHRTIIRREAQGEEGEYRWRAH
jgi:hypothetical protein